MIERGYQRRRWVSRIMLAICVLATVISIAILAMILGYVLVKGISYLNITLLTQPEKPMGVVGGGMRDDILGTLLTVGLGSVMAVPIGLLAGVFVTDFASPKVATGVRFAADILSGVPSIIAGVFAYGILVAPLHSFSAVSAGVALAIIMIPIVSRTTEESLRLVPNHLRESALALGITRWRSILSVVIPGAMTGIVTGIVLGIARIAGETAPLLFTALGSQFGFQGLLKPIGALPLLIYNYALSAYPDWIKQAWAGSFILVMIILILSIIVRWLTRERKTT